MFFLFFFFGFLEWPLHEVAVNEMQVKVCADVA